jgi:putative cell wall-binding protein
MGRIGPRRRAVGAALLLFGAIAVIPVLPTPPASAATESNRISGADRYATAAAMAKAKFPNGVGTVVMASGASFADALAGAFFAGLDTTVCPTKTGILLTAPTSLPSATATALSELKVKQVVLLGGTAAISAAVESQLQGMTSTAAGGGNLSVKRASGASRFDTMYILNTNCGPDAVGSVGGKKTAFVASGANFPDALAAAGASYGNHLPMILTASDQLSPQARQALTDLKIEQVLIMGGAGAIKPAVNSAIQAMGITIASQFAGADRVETAALFATYEVANLGFSNTEIALARGTDFADALAGAQYTGDPKPTLLTQDPTHLGAATAKYLHDVGSSIAKLTALGGSASVSTGTQDNAAAVAEGLTITKFTPVNIPKDGKPHAVVLNGTFPPPTGKATMAAGFIVSKSNKNGNCGGTKNGGSGADNVRKSDTQFEATFTIPASCPPGPYDVMVADAEGLDGSIAAVGGLLNAFTVGVTVTAISPATIAPDAAAHAVVITGDGFALSSKAFVSPGVNNSNATTGTCGTNTHEISVESLVVKSGKEIDGTLTFPKGCPTGKWDVLVDNSAAGGDLGGCLDCLTVGTTTCQSAGSPERLEYAQSCPAGRTLTITPAAPKFGGQATVTWSGGINPSPGDNLEVNRGLDCVANCPPGDTFGNNPGVSGSFTFTVPDCCASDDFIVAWNYQQDTRPNSNGCGASSCAIRFHPQF